MRIQYEEKSFEGYFNAELALRGIFFFPPGQVQEGSIGVDAVVMNHSRWLWRRLGHPYWLSTPFRGAPYREIAEEMEDFLKREISHVPDIRGNLLFQYKRSQYMVKKTAEEWPQWNEPYYRYDLYTEQQALLDRLHVVFSSQVLILYAAPAVEDVGQLVDLYKSRQLISNTNFRPAHELAGHRRNSFKDAGTHSWACSDPTRLEPFDFEQALSKFKLRETTSPELIVGFAKQVQQVLLDSNFASAYRTLVEIYGTNELGDRTPLLKAYTIMASLRELTGIQWVMLTRDA